MTYQTPPGSYPPPYQPQPKRKRHTGRWIAISLSGVVVLIFGIGIIGAAAGSGKKAASAPAPAVSIPATGSGYTAAPSPGAVTTAPAAAQQPQYTSAQQQAIDAAESYLSDGQGFSKVGLIQQLHSKYGDGFSVKLAKFAVGHVRANWRHQAVISAKGYMSDGEGFSYSGLVQQLDSPYGSQFTVAQAEYAAKAVGL
jgi:hypothetical protein